MKKKTSWKTLAGLVIAASAWRKLAQNLPIEDILPPVTRPDPPQCGRFETPKWDDEAKVWRCVPKGVL